MPPTLFLKTLFPLLILGALNSLASAEEFHSDSIASQMMHSQGAISADTASALHVNGPPKLRSLPPLVSTRSLAVPSTLLTPAEQAHFGPLSAGRHYDPRMIAAARIARQRAEPHKTWFCWRYVKEALLEAGVVESRPESAFARQAGNELCRRYGFIKLKVNDPRKAPVGAVVVYGGQDAGHVELRTENGFVSDFVSRTPYPRPLLGVYVKPS